MTARHFLPLGVAAAAFLAAAPAQAHDPAPVIPYRAVPIMSGHHTYWNSAPQGAYYSTQGAPEAHDPDYDYEAVRERWLADCRQRYRSDDNGVGGAVIGGLIGGVAGNRIAGEGDRTVGTIAGAAVGAAAGMAIDKAEDAGQARDYCEELLARHSGALSYYGYGYPHAYGYGPVMMVPVLIPRRRKCREEVIPEPAISRSIPAPAPDKRVKIVPQPGKNVKYSK